MADQRNGSGQPSNAARNVYAIDVEKFKIRLKEFYSNWNENKAGLWGSSDVIAIATPPPSEDLRYLKSSALNIWLLGYEFPETAKTDNGTDLMEAIFRAIRSQPGADEQVAPVVGHIDADELINVKKAAFLTCSVMNNVVVPKLENAIDEEKNITHSALMDEAEKAILDPTRAKAKLKADNVDICYPPIFQSGGEFDLRPSAASNDESLYYDSASVIIIAVGSRYNSYCSNVARTLMIDATPLQSKAYAVLLKAQEAAIGALKPGNKLSAAYLAALSVVEKEAPELVPNLSKSAGTGMGLEFRESGLNLNAKNDRMVKAKMVLNVSLGFQNLHNQTKNPKIQNFSLLLADTVIVGDQNPDVVTSKSSKAVKDVTYSFNEGEDEEQKPRARAEMNGGENLMSKTTLRSDNGEISKEELRRQHQAELARQKNEETARRLAGVGSANGDSRAASKTSADLVAYKNVNDIPPARDLMIQIDQKNEAVLLPIYGSMVPFHVSTIRTVSSQQDTNRTCYIRIIFNVPGTAFNPHDSNSLKHQGAIYLKEVSFRSKDPRHISEVEKLQLAGNRFKPIRLTDLWIRPVFGGRGRKLPGSLEAHINGFRYSTSRAEERVDVMYANIKHAFFQPAEKEMITLLHFHLHNHIMVGNKKTKDVQFYIEVMDVVQTLGGGKRSAYDPDEIEEEQRERERKNKINMGFQSFVNRVNDLWTQPQFSGLDLEFDQPLRELGFHGVPHKVTSFIVPTSSCLVELVETPFLVVTLGEIEIVNLERVGLGQKNFDMTIVFKDFKRDVLRIDSIPSTALDGIKEWLDTTDIKYYESRLNLNWRQILKTITDDPQSFIDDGGWEFLNLEASDSDSDNSEDSDQGYIPSDAEPDSETEEEDSDSESLVESEDDEEDDSEEDSEEEKGKTWEELEREASNADKEKANDSDSEQERNRRKAKAFGKSRAPPRPAPRMPKRPKFR
ncbi:hypothetical protein OIU78_021412 [Salix suchowensis]|nr:hypothetical protein OIU78_021412 [Salix suchowensis]